MNIEKFCPLPLSTLIGDFRIYIYIYICGHNLNQWAKIRSTFQNFPSFIAKNDPEKPPHLVWGFFTFQCFVFFIIFAFSCLSFSSFPLLLDFLKPKSGPSNEVTGIFVYCFSCRYLVELGLRQLGLLIPNKSGT